MTIKRKMHVVWRAVLGIGLVLMLISFLNISSMKLGASLYSHQQFVFARVAFFIDQMDLFNTTTIQYNIGQTNYFQGNYSSAAAAFSQALAHTSQHDKLRCPIIIQLVNARLRPYERDFNAGKINDHRTEVEQAVSLLEKCLQVDPTNAEAIRNIAILRTAQAGKPSPSDTNKTTATDQSAEQAAAENDAAAQKQQRDNNETEARLKNKSYSYNEPNW